jgi:hypothetical protein
MKDMNIGKFDCLAVAHSGLRVRRHTICSPISIVFSSFSFFITPCYMGNAALSHGGVRHESASAL